MACAAAAGGQATAAATAGRACAGGELVIAVRPHNTINDKKTDRGETEEAQSKWHQDSHCRAGAAGLRCRSHRHAANSAVAACLARHAAAGSSFSSSRHCCSSPAPCTGLRSTPCGGPRHAVCAAVQCQVIAQRRPGLRQLRLADGR